MEFFLGPSFWIMSWSDGNKDPLARTLDNNLNPFVDNMLSLSHASLYLVSIFIGILAEDDLWSLAPELLAALFFNSAVQLSILI